MNNQLKKYILMTLKSVQTYIQDVLAHGREYLSHRNEIKKFQNPRRVAIWSKVHLSQEQKTQIDQFYLKNYGQKVAHTWHRHYTAFTSNFDVKYFPELFYIPEFEHYLHSYNSAYTKAISDKNIISYLAQAIGVATPKVLCSRASGLFRDATGNLLSLRDFQKLLGNIGEAFIKPSVDTSSGVGCAVIHMKDGKDILSSKSADTIIQELGDNFIVQERLICHESLAALYPHSVNTFRIITYQWKDKILHTPIILRIGQGGHNVDNAHAGGMFIAVDEDGTLHQTAFTEFNQQYTQHPDTHITFKGYHIPYISKLIEAAEHMHAFLPQCGIYNWDFTINKGGVPVLIEVNIHGGSIWLAQMAHGKGIFGDNTADILQWIAFMKKLSPSKRKLYKPGYYSKS
ncbi:MAG: hypothetical protein IJ266_04840 [Elusimicrobiaceae bacterium]|nr:hypothetical protein [Elusimicrobiaceae bacterium]